MRRSQGALYYEEVVAVNMESANKGFIEILVRRQ